MASQTQGKLKFEMIIDEEPSFRSRKKITIASGQGSIVVGQILELIEHRFKLIGVEVISERFDAVGQRRAAAMLAQNQVRLSEADVLRPHDLVRGALFEPAVLVDARLVGKGVAADDGLVALDVNSGDV